MSAPKRPRREGMGDGVAEWNELLKHPIFEGKGVPRGDGRVVLLVPGTFGQNVYLRPMEEWLRKIGYEPVVAPPLDSDCPQRLTAVVDLLLQFYLRGRPRQLSIIGHSHGGVLAWVMAVRLGKQVSQLLLLGAPINAVSGRTALGLWNAERVEKALVELRAGWKKAQERAPFCTFPQCGCPFAKDALRSLDPRTAVLSAYSTLDPIISEWACRLDHGRNVEIKGSHVGLTLNREVYDLVARFLAEQ